MLFILKIINTIIIIILDTYKYTTKPSVTSFSCSNTNDGDRWAVPCIELFFAESVSVRSSPGFLWTLVMISTVFPRPFPVRTVVLARLVTAAAPVTIVLRGAARGEQINRLDYWQFRDINPQLSLEMKSKTDKHPTVQHPSMQPVTQEHTSQLLIMDYLESCLRLFLLESSTAPAPAPEPPPRLPSATRE